MNIFDRYVFRTVIGTTALVMAVLLALSGFVNFTTQLSTYIKVDNLLDETYMAARRPAGVRPGLPRTAYLGFTYRL